MIWRLNCLYLDNEDNQNQSTMSKITTITIAALLAAISILSCKPEHEYGPPRLVAVTVGDLLVEPEGGTCTFRYKLENPVPDGKLEVSVPDSVDWVTATSLETEGEVGITVAPNSLERERRVVLTLTYETASLTFGVVQKAAERLTDSEFTFEVLELGSTTISYKVIPEDKEMTYLSLTLEKAYMDAFETEDALFEDDMEFLQSMANSAGMTFQTFLKEEVLRQGDADDFQYNSLKTDTDYYMYAYGLREMGVKTTFVSKEVFHTLPVGTSDCVIDLTVEVDGQTATVTTVPSDDSQGYYVGVMEADDFVKYYGGEWPAAAEAYVFDIVFMKRLNGMTDQEIFDEITVSGPRTLEFGDLNAEEDYYAFACALDVSCNVAGEVTVGSFVTEPVEPSDNIITFRHDVIGVNYAEITVLPSNDDPFVTVLTEASVYKAMTGDEIIEAIVDEYGDNLVYLVKSGEGTVYRDDLKKETEYMLVAFGYDAGVPNTELFSTTFTTLAETDPSRLTFEFEVKDVTQRGAVVTVYPDPIDARYYWNLVEGFNSAEDVAALVQADYEYYLGLGYVSSLVEYMEKMTLTGVASSTFRTLDSDTEYKPFAVGIYPETGEFATEVFFGETFRTEVIIPADVYVELHVDEYYDGSEIADLYPVYSDAYGMALVPVDVTVSEGTENYYYYIFEGDCSDTDYISDERVIDELYPSGVMNQPSFVFYSYWGQTVTFMGVAEDASGQFGPVYRKVMRFTKDGALPAEDFDPTRSAAPVPDKPVLPRAL